MRGLVIFLILAIALVSFSFAYADLGKPDIKNTDNKNLKTETKITEFSTFTSAVCENKKEAVHCNDEVFVNCNGKISKMKDIAECDGVKLDFPKATGFAVFGKDWKDPRKVNS